MMPKSSVYYILLLLKVELQSCMVIMNSFSLLSNKHLRDLPVVWIDVFKNMYNNQFVYSEFKNGSVTYAYAII